MTAPARFTQADITRAVRGAHAGGAETVRLRIEIDGTLDLAIGFDPAQSAAPESRNPLDRIFDDAPETPPTA